MLILDCVKQKSLPDGTPLAVSALDWLSRGALELVFCTINGNLPPLDWPAYDKGIPIETLSAKIAGYTNRHIEGAPRRLVAAFLCLNRFFQELQKSPSGYRKCLQLLTPLRDAIGIYFSVSKKNPMIGEMTFQLAEFLRLYRDYGLVPPSALTPAIVQHLRNQSLLDKNRLVSIQLYQEIAIKINPPDLEFYAFQASEKRPPLAGIDAWTEVTLDVLDAADEIASRLRSSVYLSDIINGGMICYLLYDVVRTSLGWILKRYEESGKRAPADLYRERQVAEENRAWTAGVLEFSGRQLISIPPTQVAIQLRLTDQIPTADLVARLLEGGMATIPIYPEGLRRLWAEILTEIQRQSKIEALDMDNLSQLLEQGMHSRFSQAFQDTDFANVALSLQDDWWHADLEKSGVRMPM